MINLGSKLQIVKSNVTYSDNRVLLELLNKKSQIWIKYK